jgi:hypothetical protein
LPTCLGHEAREGDSLKFGQYGGGKEASIGYIGTEKPNKVVQFAAYDVELK